MNWKTIIFLGMVGWIAVMVSILAILSMARFTDDQQDQAMEDWEMDQQIKLTRKERKALNKEAWKSMSQGQEHPDR